MNEAQLNSIIQYSFKKESWGHKINDPLGGKGTQRPFDGFGTLFGYPVYYETKFQKEYKAFSLNLIEPHQYLNLLKINNDLVVKHYNFIILGVWINRKSFRLFFFHTPYLWNLKQKGIKSISKKELLILVDKGLYLDILSKKVDNSKYIKYIQDLNKIEEVIIKNTNEQ